MERIYWLQVSRVQASRSPESKRTIVPSPRVQNPSDHSSIVQWSSRPDSKCPVVQSVQSAKVQSPSVQIIRPESSFSGNLFKHCHLNLSAIS